MWSLLGVPGGSVVKKKTNKNTACNAGDAGDAGSIPGSGRSPGEGKWQPAPAFSPGESHGQRSLAGHYIVS